MFTLLLQLSRFLFTTVAGGAVLAGVGVLFVCCGCSGLFIDPESKPTTMTVAELEEKPEPPKEKWLELRDGYLLWAEAKSVVTTRTDRRGNVTKEKARAVFVPLVSKATFEAWQSQGSLPLSKVRVWVKMDGDEFDRNFPQDDRGKLTELLEKMKKPGDHKGLVSSLSSEESVVVEGLTKDAGSSKRILVMHRGGEPASKGFMVCFGVFLMLFGLGLGAPLVVALVRRKRGQSAEAAPAAGGATSGRDALMGAAMAGFEQGVRDAVGRGIEAARQEPRPAPPPPAPAPVAILASVQFYYLRSGQRFGPVSLTVLRNLYRAGELRPDDLVWHEGARDWMPASSSPHLKG
jgi:hypothetical protein